MIDGMPRPRPPHLQREKTRHGKATWYVRVGKGPRIRLRAEYGTPEFEAEYQAAINGETRPRKTGPESGSLAWLIDRYRETGAWQNDLSPATRRQRENIFAHVLNASGHVQYVKITQAAIVAGRERRAKTPSQARNFLDAMQGLFRWALEAKLVKVDPTANVSRPKKRGGSGFRPWTEEDVARYQARWPLGTRQRVWLDVLLYTGLRRGDAVRFGRQHIRNGVGRIATEKSGLKVTAIVPILPVLAETLEAGPCGDLTFICGEQGKPLVKESFGTMFKAACKEAGVPGSAHGVRKIAATTAANNGATTEQLKALFGWTTDSMPSLYTKTANRERMAQMAAHTLANSERTSIPAPSQQVRATGEKDQ